MSTRVTNEDFRRFAGTASYIASRGAGMIVSIISIFFGLLLSWPLSIVASKFFGNLMLEVALRFSFSKIGVVTTLVTTLIFGWIASRIPAQKAVSVSRREALAYE